MVFGPLAFGLRTLVFVLPLQEQSRVEDQRPKTKDQTPTDFSDGCRGVLRGGDEYQTRGERYAEIS